MSTVKTAFAILGLLIPAYSLTVDFAPIQVGNVWVYEESYQNQVWYTNREYKITKTIQITTTNFRNDTTYFSAYVRDSGYVDSVPYVSKRIIDVHYTVQGFKTKDSVITSKANDSIVVSENGIENFNLGDFFPFPVRDTASNLPDERFYTWESLIVDEYNINHTTFTSSNIDHFILVQNMGLQERAHTVSTTYSGDVVGGTTTISLISFNGKPAPDITVSSITCFPQNKPRNGNQTAFRQLLWINQGNYIRPQNVRAVFDVRGRAVSAAGLTNCHLNNGIYLYRD